METVLLDQIVATDYGQFDLTWAYEGEFNGDVDRSFAGQENGLVGASNPSGVYIKLARRSGGSPVRIVLRDAAPESSARENDAPWEDVVEVSVVVPAGHTLAWTSWAGMDGGRLAGVDPGSYRLRFSGRGRDAGFAGEFAEGAVDFYLIELWPAAVSPDSILRVGSEDARGYHQAWGSRR